MPSSPSLKARLEAMVDKGWLSIVPGQESERRYRITPEGRAELARLTEEEESARRGRESRH